MNADNPTILVPEQIGSPFEGGFYGGKIISHGGKKIFAFVWAPKALGETKMIWLPSYKDVPNARSCAHSMDNTIAMAEAGSELAQWSLGLDISGKRDWCLPARDVLEPGYRHLKPTTYETGGYFRDGDNPSSIPAGYPYSLDPIKQTSVEAFRQGNAEAFEEAWYWSSTQYSSDGAWAQTFGYGGQNPLLKDGSHCRARAVRLIQLNP